MLKVNVFSAKGKKISQVPVPKVLGVSDSKSSLRALAQAIRYYEDSSHPGLAKTKTRSEVSRTKKKWYRQKGTGGARHGAKSAHIFVGGGVAHGPDGRKRELLLPSKARRNALSIALSEKVNQGLLVLVNNLGSLTKTKETAFLYDSIVSNLKDVKSDKVTFVLVNDAKEKVKPLRNLKNSQVVYFKDLNAYQVFFGGLTVFDNDIFTEKKTVTKKEVVSKITDKKKPISKTNTKKKVNIKK